MINHIIIHIGLIKTGSTFLQSQVFPLLNDDLVYIGPTDCYLKRSNIVLPTARVLISNENLSGSPFNFDVPRLSYFEQFKNAVDNLVRIHVRPKIIVGFREPASFIESVYKQSLHEGSTKTWSEFTGKKDEAILENYMFSRYIIYLQEKLDRNDVFLYTIDQLKENPEKIVRIMTSFILDKSIDITKKIDFNKKLNTSVPLELEKTLIRLNKISRVMRRNIGFGLGIRVGKLILNPSRLTQNILPSLITYNARRPLDELKGYFKADWQLCEKMIFESQKSSKN